MKKAKSKVSAIIVAAGKGLRMNMNGSKQFIEIAGKPVLARTVQAFENCEAVDEIIIVVNMEDIVYCKHNIVDEYGFSKVSVITAGGATRQESVYHGLTQLKDTEGIVLIHDGARPFIGHERILENIAAAEEYGACCEAVPVKDTVKQADPGGIVEITLKRESLWAAQTPQSFKHDIILKAHKKAIEEGFTGTDDATLVERLGYPMRLIKGSYNNIKITTQEDLLLAEAIANKLD
jgi:2-C-methyl-D-erythritol 4-phosphate cytidylyltransferase